MGRLLDTFLQLLFVAGIIVVVLLLYFTRIAPLRADNAADGLTNEARAGEQYADLQTVYQFEQEERRLRTRIGLLRAEYAAAVTDYAGERKLIESSALISELEKREKLSVLQSVYPDSYFARKLELIDQEQAQLELLLSEKCKKYCLPDDLPAGPVGVR